MTTAATILLGVAGIAALANWWSRWTDHRVTELWSKPATLVALIGVALTIDVADPTVRWWFVAGLVLSLAGDVFLLGDDRWFVPGLAAFLSGHVAYIVGFVLREPAVDGPGRWTAVALAVVAVSTLAGTAGRRILDGARRRDASLVPPVTAYLIVISSMLVAASATLHPLAILGAALFVVSDSILGWRQFVAARPWMAPAVMVTYHLAQTGLVLSLL